MEVHRNVNNPPFGGYSNERQCFVLGSASLHVTLWLLYVQLTAALMVKETHHTSESCNTLSENSIT